MEPTGFGSESSVAGNLLSELRQSAVKFFDCMNNYGPCEHLHGIAPALDRPITGRPLPRELLQSPPPARQRGGTNGEIDDSRPIGINNIPARAHDDYADSDADISRTRQTNRPKANDGGP
ncbi:jg12017 [Pararge aegeria aegeria]|uniref:Jg12017 protein n=1 Tax=Pararge aegeria aegeria TaxID=348720 RepID=A0A8S4R3X9_9NEOP|nr:jg12017 [Pararge aegeria aegeria]